MKKYALRFRWGYFKTYGWRHEFSFGKTYGPLFVYKKNALVYYTMLVDREVLMMLPEKTIQSFVEEKLNRKIREGIPYDYELTSVARFHDYDINFEKQKFAIEGRPVLKEN